MGPLFVVMFWAILLTPVGLAIGAVLSFLTPWVYYRVRGTPPEKRKRGFLFRCIFSMLFTALFVPSVCLLGLYLSFAGADDYWNYRGAFDFFRMPLEPPYELVMIDVLDEASLCKWKDGAAIIPGITRYEKRGPWIAGLYEEGFVSRKPGWFLFDCRSGTASGFADERSLAAACAEKGFMPGPVMKSVQENWDSYWEDPGRRRK